MDKGSQPWQHGDYNFDRYNLLSEEEKKAASDSILIGLNSDGSLAAIADQFGEDETAIPRDQLLERLRTHRSKDPKEVTFRNKVEYHKWLNNLPEPCAASLFKDGKQDLQDGDGNQYRVVITD